MATRPEGVFARVTPQAGASLPRARPDAFGAGVAAGVRELAGTLQARDRDLRRTEQSTQANLDSATLRVEMDDAVREARQSFNPEHAAQIEQVWQERQTALLEGISDSEVRSRTKVALANYGAALVSRERDWATLRGQEVATDNFRDAARISANRVRRLENPEDYASELLLQIDAIDGLPASDKVKDALRDETEQEMAIAFLQGRIEADPRLAKGMIASGAFDDVLSPSQIESLLNGSDVGIRRLEVAERRGSAEREAAAREQIQVLEEADRQGIILPPEQFDQAAALAIELGDPSLSLKLDGMRANRQFAQIWGNGNANPAQRGARIAELAGLQKRTPDQDRELKYLQDKGGELDAAFERDPVAAIAEQSGAPAVDLADPASLQARLQWSREQGRATQRYVPPLARSETGPLRDLFERRQFGQLFDTLDNFDKRGRQEVAAMIAPDDLQFQETATLTRQFRDQVVSGREVLKANPKILVPEDINSEEGMALIEAEFAQATRSMDRAQAEAIRQNGRAIMAAIIQQTGAAPEPARLRQAFQRALGMRGNGAQETGGMKRWGGTGEWFMMPDGLTQQDFGNAVFGFARQNRDRLPVNRDGSVADLRQLTPVAIGGDLYEFHSSGGSVARKANGEVFRLLVRPGKSGGGQ